MDDFRRIVELKYRLMPYVYAQAKHDSRLGHPMVRPLFFEYPEDRTSWLVEDEYLFGTDLLVAPLMEETRSREVYLPPGLWFDYFGGEVYEGTKWHRIGAGEVPAIMLVRDGAAIPHARLAQHTGALDWSEIEVIVFGPETDAAEGLFCLPGDDEVVRLTFEREGGRFVLNEDPLDGRVAWKAGARRPRTSA